MKKTFCAGEYFIGSPTLVLDFLELSELGSGDNFALIKGLDCAVFCCQKESISDNSGFIYSIENESLALLPKVLIDDEVLERKLYTLHTGILYSKFSAFKLGRVLDFSSDFEVELLNNELKIEQLEFQL